MANKNYSDVSLAGSPEGVSSKQWKVFVEVWWLFVCTLVCNSNRQLSTKLALL